MVEKQRKEAKHIINKPIKVQFVNDGEPCEKSKQNASVMLPKARDQQLEVYLAKKLQFPDIAPTNLRQDVCLLAVKEAIIELKVHWEERCSKANERKRTQYDELLAG